MSLQTKMKALRSATGAAEEIGWMNDEVCWLLHGLVRFYRPSLVIQTGHLWGKSALVCLDALEPNPLDRGSGMGDSEFAAFVESNSPPKVKGTLISIDPAPRGGLELLMKWHPQSFQFWLMESRKFFEVWEDRPEEGARVFGIVDGDHTEAGARRDLREMAKLGAGMILLDDTSWLPHLGAVGRELDDYQATEFPDYNGVMLLTRIR